MHVVRTPSSARAIARTLQRPVGFVPTMGALHAGHLALVDRAKRENATLAASIFVNPMQFGPGEDYARYPRAFDRDAELLEGRGIDLLYSPGAERMYGEGFATRIAVGLPAAGFEGAARPGHFDGVATVVAKLLHAIEPTTMYLGQKDAQQVAVLRRMISDLDLPVDVVVCPTVREPDGLALSSRNTYLSPPLRAAAPSLHRALVATGGALATAGSVEEALAVGRAALESPLTWEYLSFVDATSFEPLHRTSGPGVVVAAVRAGATRLIDNLTVAGPDGIDPLLTPERHHRTVRA
jgi:pantoate--beta-alanine ligase